MAKAANKHTEASVAVKSPPEWVRKFIAKGGDISALGTALRDPLHDLPPALAEHFNRDEKARRDFEKAAGSILGSIGRHRVSPTGPAPAMTAVDLEQIVERLTDLISRQQSAPIPAPKRRKRRQVDRVTSAINKLYPGGVVPDGVTIKAVHRAVAAALASESRRLGLADPSPESVARAIGRK